MDRTVFLYWVGKEYKLINILRNLIYLHSTNGKGYSVKLLNRSNVKDYVVIPDCFDSLLPAHQADFIRVNVICKYGGIWLDSDTLVLDSLDSLFDIIEKQEGFFIRENNECLWNGIFGSKPNTLLMCHWRDEINKILNIKREKISWTEIGIILLETIKATRPEYYSNYKIFNGLDTMYPANWNQCVREFIEQPYNNYKNLLREFQPLIVLVNSVYKALENKTEEILGENMPLNYFINKSIENMKLINYDFIEIGTSNFDTLIQVCDNTTKGISVDAVKYYIDALPNRENCIKINVGISNINSIMKVYYIPEEIIKKHQLPDWFKGCNCIDSFHPLHIQHNVIHLCKIDEVKVITPTELFYQNKVKTVAFLKIDTEGHDCIILNALYSYLKYLPKTFYPKKILFETNEHTKKIIVDEVILLYEKIGYKIQSRGYDTVLILSA